MHPCLSLSSSSFFCTSCCRNKGKANCESVSFSLFLLQCFCKRTRYRKEGKNELLGKKRERSLKGKEEEQPEEETDAQTGKEQEGAKHEEAEKMRNFGKEKKRLATVLSVSSLILFSLLFSSPINHLTVSAFGFFS